MPASFCMKMRTNQHSMEVQEMELPLVAGSGSVVPFYMLVTGLDSHPMHCKQLHQSLYNFILRPSYSVYLNSLLAVTEKKTAAG